MKASIFTLVIALFATTLFAQEPTKERNPAERPSADEIADMRVEKMTKQLNLTPQQQATIKAATQKFMEARRKHMETKEENKQEFHTQMRTARAEYRNTIQSTLTDEQKAKLEEIRKERGARKAEAGRVEPNRGRHNHIEKNR